MYDRYYIEETYENFEEIDDKVNKYIKRGYL